MRRFMCLRLIGVALGVALLGSCGGDSSPPAPPLRITADSPPAGTTGTAYPGYTFTASGGTPPLSWTESGSLPPGLTLSASGQLSGMAATAGKYAISVTVSDSSMPPLTSSAQVNLEVADSAIVIAPAAPPAGTVTYPYAGFTFNASGGSPPYTWKASATLPPGLTFGSDGTVSGTPTQVGTFAFSVTATDSAETPTISPPLATQIMVGNPGTLTLNPTPAPPAGVVGAPYGPFAFNVTGGFLPLKWSITAGSLPPGLTLGNGDGSLSGTPTSAAALPYSFTVKVTDSGAPPASSSLTFAVSVTLPPPPSINFVEPPTGTVGSAYPPAYAPFQFTAGNGVPPLVWSEAGPMAAGLTFNAQGALTGTPTTYGKYPITVDVMDALHRPAQPFPTIVRVSLARPPAMFTATGSMRIPRSGHAAALLLSGKVLVTGGGNGAADATAELYDPATGTFSSANGNMTEARSGHTATLLGNPAAANYGKVLIVGSVDTSAELYDPSTGKFVATGSLHHARTAPTATLLNTGKVLIVGGNTTSGDLTAELYDPASGSFSDSGSTTILRTGHTATLLLDGRVLVAGGGSATAELYEPSSGTFIATAGDMTKARSGHTATLLAAAEDKQYGQDGYVLIIGTDGSADLYDPGTGIFEGVGSLGTLLSPELDIFYRPKRTASLRNDGTVLAAGGYFPLLFPPVCGTVRPTGNSTDVAALLAPESDGFTLTGTLNTPRDTHTATVLQDGSVLVVGGTRREFYPANPFTGGHCFARTTVLSSAELFR